MKKSKMLIKNKKQAVLISVIFLCFFAMLAGIAAAYIRKFDNALEEENKRHLSEVATYIGTNMTTVVNDTQQALSSAASAVASMDSENERIRYLKDLAEQYGFAYTCLLYTSTSLRDIYAAGDCTQSYDITSQTAKNMAILPNAYMQGEVAGQNMAGGSAVYEKAFPVNSMGLLGLYMMTAGSYLGEATTVTVSYTHLDVYKRQLSNSSTFFGSQ